MYSKIINTYNYNHLGDGIFCLICFYHIKDFIEQNNIKINFYCYGSIIDQISEFNYSKNVFIYPIEQMPTNEETYDMWVGQYIENYYYYDYVMRDKHCFIGFLKYFYDIFLQKINIPISISTFIYEDPTLYTKCAEINERTNNKYRNIDFLFNNSRPCSGQIDYNESEWDNFAIKLSEKYNIITTKKVGHIKCTLDDNLTVKDIASISTDIKKFIILGNGVFTGLMNEYIFNKAEIVYFLCGRDNIYRDNFVNKTHINQMWFLLD